MADELDLALHRLRQAVRTRAEARRDELIAHQAPEARSAVPTLRGITPIAIPGPLQADGAARPKDDDLVEVGSEPPHEILARPPSFKASPVVGGETGDIFAEGGHEAKSRTPKMDPHYFDVKATRHHLDGSDTPQKVQGAPIEDETEEAILVHRPTFPAPAIRPSWLVMALRKIWPFSRRRRFAANDVVRERPWDRGS